MMEEEWFRETDVRRLAAAKIVSSCDRKLRLFGCQCLRCLGDDLPAESVECIRFVERALDQQMRWKDAKSRVRERTAGWDRHLGHTSGWLGGPGNPKLALLIGLPRLLISDQTSEAVVAIAAWCVRFRTNLPHVFGWHTQTYEECFAIDGEVFEGLDTSDYLAPFHDIFGNPFRPVAFSPAWRTSTAIGIATQMYDSRNFNAMPILADALQDAGCEDESILSHCRDEKQVHVRGCWVVDLVLGKK